jgi:hypothetical protein
MSGDNIVPNFTPLPAMIHQLQHAKGKVAILCDVARKRVSLLGIVVEKPRILLLEALVML